MSGSWGRGFFILVPHVYPEICSFYIFPANTSSTAKRRIEALGLRQRVNTNLRGMNILSAQHSDTDLHKSRLLFDDHSHPHLNNRTEYSANFLRTKFGVLPVSARLTVTCWPDRHLLGCHSDLLIAHILYALAHRRSVLPPRVNTDANQGSYESKVQTLYQVGPNIRPLVRSAPSFTFHEFSLRNTTQLHIRECYCQHCAVIAIDSPISEVYSCETWRILAVRLLY